MGDGLLRGLADHFGPPPGAARFLGDPVGFAREAIEWPTGESLTDYQAESLQAVVDRGRVALRGPHGLGKTTCEALAVLWFATTRDAAGVDWKCATTAGAWRQLTRYLWPEIAKWARRLRWDVLARGPFDERSELLQLSLNLRHGQAFAAASDNAALLEGLHADHVLYLLDEAKSIPPATWDAIEGAFSGATGGRAAFALAASTPGTPEGRFFEIAMRRPGLEDWYARHVSLDEAVDAGRVSREWARQRAAQWGVGSAIFQNRVLGEFATEDSDGIVPLAWVEAAIDRWRDIGSATPVGAFVVGVDVARMGADRTVLALRQGAVVRELRRLPKQDTMATTGAVARALRDVPGGRAVVDVIGIGAGVVDRLREQNVATSGFNSSARSGLRDRSGELEFGNQRAEAWWSLRELLDPAYGASLALPDDDELIGDLTAPRWRLNSAGRLFVEDKDEVRKRLGRSPDAGDAVVMSLFRAGRDLSAPSAGGGATYMSWFDDQDEDREWFAVRDGALVKVRGGSGLPSDEVSW